MSRFLQKLIAMILVVTLAGANVSILGMYSISYAITDKELSGQTSQTENSNVEFNSYFEGGSHLKTESIDSTTAKLYVNVKVKNAGYLKNGTIEFKDVNFKIGDVKNDNVQSVDKENNKIVLKQLNNGSDVTLEIPISFLNNEEVSLDYFAKETKANFSAIYVDGNGKEKNISKEITNKLSWSRDAQANVKSEVTKYIPYATENKYGVMVQTKISSKIADNKLPIKTTEINVVVPEINGNKPSSVNVIATDMSATKGADNGLEFTSENYTYNKETGIVTIKTENASDKVSWKKDAQDEYLVTYIFDGQEIYNYAKTNGVNTSVSTSAKFTVYNNEEKSINVDKITTEVKMTDRLGTIADFDIYLANQISKGQIYANYDVSKKKEVEYSEQYVSTINSADLTDTIRFNQQIDAFMTKEGKKAPTTVSGNNYTYNKSVSIDVDVFNKILGEDGSIDVYNTSDTKLGTINKSVENKEGKYTLDISDKNTNQIYIIASKPQTEGQLVINVNKAIKTSIDYNKSQMQTFTKMQAELEGKASTSTVNATEQLLLKETNSVADITVSKKDLSTVVKNENVEIRATLNTADVHNALFKNPTLKITLPSYISNVNIKKTDIVMANGLKIKGTPSITTENGKQVITITLEGMQDEYTIGAEYEGTIVILNTDLTVKTLTPSHADKITMKFTNANDTALNQEGTVDTNVNFVAPTGVVAANGISNYIDDKSDMMSISEEGITKTIPAYASKKTAKVYGKIINNYSNKISDVVILGRMPSKDNKKIDSTDSLGSTFDMTLKTGLTISGIDSSKYTVYYSENASANKDLSDTNNGWSTSRTANAKSYMIVTKNYDMASGDMIEFSYDAEVPENLKHNNSVSEMYKVYYNNVSSIGTMAETKVSSIMTLTTGQGAEITAELKATTDVVREGQIVKMNVVVKNTGSVTAKNVKVNIPKPDEVTFMEYSSGNGFFEMKNTNLVLDAGTIEAGKTKELSFIIKVKEDLSEINGDEIDDDDPIIDGSDAGGDTSEEVYPKDISFKLTITADDTDGSIPAQEYKLSVQKGQIAINMYTRISENQVLNNGDVIDTVIKVKNISKGDSLANTIVTIPLPQGLKYKDAVIKESLADESGKSDGISYDEKTNVVTINIGTLDIQKYIDMNLQVENYSGDLTLYSTAKADGTEEHYSNKMQYKSEIIDMEVSELTSTPKYVKEGSQVTYTLKVSNKGDSVITGLKVTDTLPDGLTFVNATYNYNGTEHKITNLVNGQVEIFINQLNAKETITINVTAKAGVLPDTNDKTVENKMSVVANHVNEITTNTVTNIIEYYKPIHDKSNNDNPNPGPSENRFKMTGTAWLDSNKNGKRDSDEQLLSNIKVMLLSKEDNKIVKDVDTNEQKITTTADNGTYEFSNLKSGEYFVIFVYDASRYSLTTYRQKDVDSSLNSDVVDINITLDGKRTIAGTTDVIKITDDNARDIDIGLYSAEKFDLKLDKYISKITRTTPSSGTKTYEYNNSKAAKIEVLGSNLGKSSAIIEYKIVVTNEGAVAGYAKKIVDYLPKGVSFSTELNKDWYLSDNGNVYNASLANEIIKPGESKELTLVVTKKITEDSLGDPINNNAEIYESYNEQGLKDIDSTPGNKAQNEDDMSMADVIFSIVTGKIIMYTTITLGVIAILGFGVFEIKKRVLKKRKN